MTEHRFAARDLARQAVDVDPDDVLVEASALASGPPENLALYVTESRRLRQENLDLRAALETQPMIEQAKGVVMARYRATPDQAFGILRRWSQDRNIKVRELAHALVEAASPPLGPEDSPELPPKPLLGRSELRLGGTDEIESDVMPRLTAALLVRSTDRSTG